MNQNTGKKSNRTRRFIIFLVVFFLIGISAFFVIQNVINKKLSSFVSQISKNVYELNYSKIRFGIHPVSIRIYDLRFKPNDSLSLIVLKKFPEKSFYSFDTRYLEINGIDLIDLFREKALYIKNVNVSYPAFQIRGNEILNKNDSLRIFDRVFLDLAPFFEKYLKQIRIEKISFTNANYGFYSNSGLRNQISKGGKISMEITGFRTEPTMIFRKKEFFDSDDMKIKILGFRNDLGDSLHVVDIDTVEYSLKKSLIKAKGFHLAPTHFHAEKNSYRVDVPSLILKSNNLTRFSFEDSIKVHYVLFENPTIRFNQKQDPEKIKIKDINDFDLYSLIKNQFSVIEVDSFYLKNASLDIYRQPDSLNFQQQFKSIDIALLGFELDSVSGRNKRKLFFADNLEMKVAGYQLFLDDKENKFHSDTVFVSTIAKTIGVKNISLQPQGNSKSKLHTNLSLNCNSILFRDIDLKKLYHTRRLFAGKIEITAPNVKLLNHTDLVKTKKNKQTGLLYDLVSPYMKGVYTDNVLINKGFLRIESVSKNNLTGYFDTNFDFNLKGFSLDSLSLTKNDLFFHASDFNLVFADYEMKLVDNLHKISAQRILVESKNNKLEIDSLHLQPTIDVPSEKIMRQFNRSELYDILVPKITLTGIDLQNAFFFNKLNIQDFRIIRPEIYIVNYGLLRNNRDKLQLKELYQLVFNYITDFNILKIEVPDGEIKWINHSKKGNTSTFDNLFSATLYNFRLNETELKTNRLFFADDFDISVKDQSFHLSDSVHILQAEEIVFSSAKNGVQLKNGRMYPVKNTGVSTLFNLKVPEIKITDFDLEKAWLSKEFRLGKLELNSPEIEIRTQKGLVKKLDFHKFDFPLPAYINSLELQELEINNGKVKTFETDGSEEKLKSSFIVSISLPGVSVKNDAKKQIEIVPKNINAQILNFKAPIGSGHFIEIGKLNFDRENKQIGISNFKIIPPISSGKSNKFALSSPNLVLGGFDLDLATRENKYYFNDITISHPVLKIDINDTTAFKSNSELPLNDFYPLIEPYANALKIERFLANDLSLNLNWFGKKLTNRTWNLKANSVVIGKESNRKQLFGAHEVEISTSNLNAKSKNGFYEYSVGSLVFNSLKQNILISDIRLKPLVTKDEFVKASAFQSDYMNMNCRFAELRNIDQNTFQKNGILYAGKLIIGPSEFAFYKDKRLPFNEKQRPPWPQDLLNNMDIPFGIDSVLFMPSKITYSETTSETGEIGSLVFSDLTFRSGYVSNRTGLNSNKRQLKMDASCKLFEKYRLTAQFNFNLADKNHTHQVSGNLEQMPMFELNPFLKSTSQLAIESGKINKLEFDFNLNNTESSGQLFFEFEDFKVSVFNQIGGDARKSKVASLWINSMVLNQSNPKSEKFNPVKVNFKRDEKRFVINYWWKSILSGIKESIGIKNQETK